MRLAGSHLRRVSKTTTYACNLCLWCLFLTMTRLWKSTIRVTLILRILRRAVPRQSSGSTLSSVMLGRPRQALCRDRVPREIPGPFLSPSHMRLEWARAQVGRQLFCATWSQGTQDAASLMQRRQPLWVFLQGRPLRDFQKGKTWTSSAPYNGRRWTKLLEHNGSALKRVGRTSDLRRTPY